MIPPAIAPMKYAPTSGIPCGNKQPNFPRAWKWSLASISCPMTSPITEAFQAMRKIAPAPKMNDMNNVHPRTTALLEKMHPMESGQNLSLLHAFSNSPSVVFPRRFSICPYVFSCSSNNWLRKSGERFE